MELCPETCRVSRAGPSGLPTDLRDPVVLPLDLRDPVGLTLDLRDPVGLPTNPS